MKKFLPIIIVGLMLASFIGCTPKNEEADTTEESVTDEILDLEVDTEIPAFDFDQSELPAIGEEIAIMKTSMGDIYIRLFADKAPKTVENFLTLAQTGYYDGLPFHRIIDGFMVQGGKPDEENNNGESAYGYPFEDEFSYDLHHYRGALSMANSGPDTNGSQFFIVQAGTEGLETYVDGLLASVTEQDMPVQDPVSGGVVMLSNLIQEGYMNLYKEKGGTPFLDYYNRLLAGADGKPMGAHSVFGQVLKGMDVVDVIAAVETDENNKPVENVILENVEVVPFSEELKATIVE